MENHQKKENHLLISLIVLIICFVIWTYLIFEVDIGFAANGAAGNQTLNTSVNISNSAPEPPAGATVKVPVVYVPSAIPVTFVVILNSLFTNRLPSPLSFTRWGGS